MKVIPLLAIVTLAACSSVTEPSGQTAQVSCDREVATGTTIAVKKCRTAEQVEADRKAAEDVTSTIRRAGSAPPASKP